MIAPLRFRTCGADDLLFVNDAGDFFLSDETFLERYVGDDLTSADRQFLERHGHTWRDEQDFAYLSYLWRLTARCGSQRPFNYIILVPTLRCNLSCSYCQVSRVAERATGFDWNDETLQHVIRFLDGLETREIKVEFQGGEPLLRTDLLETIYAFCQRRFDAASFVVCTNLQHLGPKEWDFLAKPNVHISTSLDGDALTHQRNRTRDSGLTTAFLDNLTQAIERFGADKVSALPTIDYSNPPDIDALLDAYLAFGFRSIYLRPVNHQGFARKAFGDLKDDIGTWNAYYFAFVDRLIQRNYERSDDLFEEYYFTLCLKRVLQAGQDHHVDLRNPNLLGNDYLVVDYDGRLYPTDEARMITRTGQIDLAVGDVQRGVDTAKIAQLNGAAFNNFHEDCIHCPYQPFCGTDVVDDLSRYGRIDMPRHETWFCKRHMSLFDKVFEALYSPNPMIRHSICHWLGLPGQGTDLGLRHHDTATH